MWFATFFFKFLIAKKKTVSLETLFKKKLIEMTFTLQALSKPEINYVDSPGDSKIIFRKIQKKKKFKIKNQGYFSSMIY